MDLFTPVIPVEKQHSNFKNIVEYYSQETRDELQHWADGFVDRDGKFVKEFQTTFNSSFWELYLNASFQALGFKLDYSHQSPDFIVQTPSYTFSAEAVIASHADGFTPEWEWSQPNDSNEIIRVACIRLANAISFKYKKFCDLYSKLPHVKGTPFVICLTPFEQPMSFSQNLSAIRRVLYGYEILTIEHEKTGERLVVGETKFENTYKDNGADIPLSIFLDPKHACISAIIFSTTARMCKLQALSKHDSISSGRTTTFCADRFDPNSTTPRRIVGTRPNYRETLLDGLHIFLNPYASEPLNLSPFCNREIAMHEFNLNSAEYLCHMPDDFLIHRYCHTLISEENIPEPKPKISNKYKQPSVKTWPDNELRPVEAQVMMFDQNHLAHYRGWTILVAHDNGDDDWSAQSVFGTYTSVPDYMNANKRSPLEQSAILQKFCASKDLAWQEMRKKIDEIIISNDKDKG